MGEIKVVTEQLDAAYKLFDRESGNLYYIKKQIDGCKNRLRDGLFGLVLDPMYSKMNSASMSADFLGSKLEEISNVLLKAKKEYEDADNMAEVHENEMLDNLGIKL